MLYWALTLILILSGIILTQAVILHVKFSDSAKGYMLSAFKWTWKFLTSILVVQTIIAAVLTLVLSTLNFIPLPLLSLFVGVMVVLLPSAFEHFVFARKANVKRIRNPLVRALNNINLAIIRKFGGAISTLMEQDVHDAQRGWGLGLSTDEMRRRIRKIFRCHAQAIAKKKRDDKIMRRDVDFWPFEHLYLLLEHLGRNRVRYEIMNPPDMQWDGEEHRRHRGTVADRKNVADQTALPPRYYDDETLIKEIRAGKPKRIKAASVKDETKR